MSVTYVAADDPNLKIKIRDKRMQFQNKRLVLENEQDIEFLDNLLTPENPHLMRAIRKLDYRAAEEIARKHMEEANQPVAHKGSVTSTLEKDMIARLDNEMTDLDLDDPKVKQAYDDVIASDKNVQEVEHPNLDAVAAEQQAKIDAANEQQQKEKEAAEETKIDLKAAGQAGTPEKPAEEKPAGIQLDIGK